LFPNYYSNPANKLLHPIQFTAMIYFEIPSAQEAGHRTPLGIAAAEARPDGRIQQESKNFKKM
jgi:hypothetical protein